MSRRHTARTVVFALILAGLLTATAAFVSAQTISSALSAPSAAAGGLYGQSVNDAGDVNGDGLADLIVGSPGDSRNGINLGSATIFFGGSGDRLYLEGSLGREAFGWSVAGIGDVNGDGYDDVAVGAPLNNAVGTEQGRVYVYYGGASMDATADLVLDGELPYDHFGWCVSRGGDLDGDGRPDFLVGAPMANAGASDNGAVYLYLGDNGDPSTDYAKRFEGEIGGDQFGYSVSDVPDYKGDGTPAFVVGAPYVDQPVTNGGRAYLFFAGSGGNLPSSTADVVFKPDSGDPSDMNLGWSVSQAGFFDADARTDVVIGAPGYLAARGLAAVFYGEADPSAEPSPDQVILGETGGDSLGVSVADVGDVLGSDRTEIVVGAPSRDVPGENAGMVYLFEGGSTYTSASQGIVVERGGLALIAPAGDRLGVSASYAGDLDGDGVADFALGAPVGNNAQNALTGYVGIVSSSGVPVPVIPVRMDQRPLADDRCRLEFRGPVVDAPLVSLWSVETGGGRLLADLHEGLVHEGDALVAVLSSALLREMEEVELRWTTAEGLQEVERFALPTLPALHFRLLPPSPNPFNPATVVGFELPSAMHVSLQVLDLRGRVVRTLLNGWAGPGHMDLRFDGRDEEGRILANGVYHFLLKGHGMRATTRAVLVK